MSAEDEPLAGLLRVSESVWIDPRRITAAVWGWDGAIEPERLRLRLFHPDATEAIGERSFPVAVEYEHDAVKALRIERPAALCGLAAWRWTD